MPIAGGGSMGDYGWSMDFDTSQDIAARHAVEDGRVLEYPIEK